MGASPGTVNTYSVEDVWVWGVAVAAGLVALSGGLIFLWRRFKRWTMAADESEEDGAFTLQDLREMKARGDITEDEYERLRAGILSAVRGASTPREDKRPPSLDLND